MRSARNHQRSAAARTAQGELAGGLVLGRSAQPRAPPSDLDGDGEEHDRQGRSIVHEQGAPIWIEDRHRQIPTPPSTTRTRRVAYRMLSSATQVSATSSGVPDRRGGAVPCTVSRTASPLRGPRAVDQPRCDRMHPDLGPERVGDQHTHLVEVRLRQLDELVTRATLFRSLTTGGGVRRWAGGPTR